jgi:hypothetical protein
MADVYTPQEIAEIFEAYNNAVKSGTPISREMAEQMADAARGIKHWTSELRASSLGFRRSLGELTSSMLESAKGAGQYTDTLSKGGDYLSTWFSGMGPWGKAGALLVKGATMYVGAVAKQADSLFKSYNEISRSGATAAGGMTELYGTMQKFGYGIAELGNLAGILQENSNNLALLGGTVFEGTQQFAGLSQQIRTSDIGTKFEKAGIGIDQQNKGIANYLRIITITGQQQLKTSDQLRAGAEDYILQQDRLTKLTGASADEQQRITEQALSEERFAASQRQLRRNGMEEEAKARETMNIYLAKNVGPDVAKGFRDITTGFLNSKDAQKFYRSFPDAARLVREGADPAEIAQAVTDNAKMTGELTESLGMAGRANEIYADQGELTRAAGLKNYQAALEQAKKQVEVTDKTTDNMVDMAQAQRNTRDFLQDMIQLGIVPVTDALSGLANMIEGITSFFGGKSRVGQGMDQRGGYGKSGTGTLGGSLKSTAAGAAAGAAVGSVVPGVGTAIGAVAGGVLGFMGYEKAGGTGKKPEDLIQFTTGSGSQQAFNNLQPEIQRALMGAAGQYLEQTGKKLILNSASRTQEKQKELYDAYVARGKTGMPAAPPGSSLHESGRAVDIEQGKNDRAAISALNNAGLFQTVMPKDPVHFTPRGGPPEDGGYAYGGIATGPKTGYQAMLHGTEAVVPLPDGKTIPVNMPGFSNSLADQTGIMTQQLIKLDELVRVMQNQVGLSHKILQRTS